MKAVPVRSLTAKLVVAFLIVGMLPLGSLAWITLRSADTLGPTTGKQVEAASVGIMAKIDRTLHERCGDVQAFALNQLVQDKSQWFRVGSTTNRIADLANRYVALYGCYLLSLVVDTEGRVIAVNDMNARGKPVDTAWIYGRNYKDAPWFREVMAGNFMRSGALDATCVQDAQVDEEMKKVCGEDGLVLGFSAAIKDAHGQVIGVWNNRAAFGLVEEIIVDAYKGLKNHGLATAEIALLDQRGRVLIDYDPSSTGGDWQVKYDPEVTLKHNLAANGIAEARALGAGHAGSGRQLNEQKNLWQLAGYAPSQGALGFPGMKWGLLVRVNEHESLAIGKTIRTRTSWVLSIAAGVLVGAAWWVGRAFSKPILARLADLRASGEHVAAAAAQVSAASQSLADGASEQAAALEETSASLEEMTSMVKLNAEAANKAKALASETRAAAETGATDMADMRLAMGEIKASSSEVGKIVKDIDAIAFQTNILALNAAVEAARAGEAGAGFAVVADEVRNLAQRSAAAAKETAAKIEAAISKSDRGVQISNKVAQNFEQIAGKTRAVDQLVAEIATASDEQAQGVTLVNLAVAEIDKVTQSNAASAEESASAAKELSTQAIAVGQSVSALEAMVSGRSAPSAEPRRDAGTNAEPHRSISGKKQPALPVPGRWTGHRPVTSQAGRSRQPALVQVGGAGSVGRSAIPLSNDDKFKDF